jgi:hemoglobin
MNRDIENRKDIEQLIDTFYAKVRADELIGFIFNDVAKVNWQKHLPVMYDFWENIIFYTNNYSGNPMMVHMHLGQRTPLTKEHFERWLELFTGTVDELFEGAKATTAKEKARSIAAIMQVKISGQF